MFSRLIKPLCFSALIILTFLPETSLGRKQKHCDPLACGNIGNISFPFRLRDDPRHYCGDSHYELVCENNTTLLLYTLSHKFRVKSINYHNHTIRLSDASINENETNCSLPQYSQYQRDFINYRYFYYSYRKHTEMLIAWPVTFLSCPYPVNYSFYVKADHNCVERDDSSSSSRYTYMAVGPLYASDVGDKCSIDLVFMTSMPFQDHNNFSLLQVHLSLVYGFELSWDLALCHNTRCCQWDDISGRFICTGYYYPYSIIRSMIILISYYTYTYPYHIMVIMCSIILIICAALVYLAAKTVIGVPILLGLLVYKFRRRHMSVFDVIEHFLLHHNNLVPIRYSYSDIKKMTRGFQEKLGQGGYGSVYKGKLRSGHDVAVKVLRAKSKSNGQDFMNEVATIGRIHHVNVVKLVGYCAEGSKRALLYDFMPNGSLDKYILRQETTDSLNWEKKYEIAVGVARGIEYLHRGCDIQILHFDIKPHNILLDDNFTPKISDFGLAKFFSTEKDTVTLTAARGTIGYVAPELINRSIGGVSYKADVYSFGMLLMEMVGLKRDLAQNGGESSQYFPYWIYNHLEHRKDIEIGCGGEIDDVDEKIKRKMAIVALWCIQMSPGDRPSMSRVMEMLEEGEVESLQIPPQPSYSPQEVAQTWETDTTDSIALLCEDNSKN